MSPSSGRTRPINTLCVKLAAPALAIAAMTGCAQTAAPGYYDPPAGSSITDSQYSATGANARHVVRAPWQLQISTDRPARSNAQDGNAQPAAALDAEAATPATVNADAGTLPQTAGQAEAARIAAAGTTPAAAGTGSYNPAAARFAPQAQTYLGTLPCLTPGVNCPPTKMTVTLAPNGRWRARSETVVPEGQPQTKPVLEQGCWDATTVRPVRVMLTDGQGATRADFVVQNNALRVRSMNGQTPSLDYFLTRQPDLDPIVELDGSKLPACD